MKKSLAKAAQALLDFDREELSEGMDLTESEDLDNALDTPRMTIRGQKVAGEEAWTSSNDAAPEPFRTDRTVLDASQAYSEACLEDAETATQEDTMTDQRRIDGAEMNFTTVRRDTYWTGDRKATEITFKTRNDSPSSYGMVLTDDAVSALFNQLADIINERERQSRTECLRCHGTGLVHRNHTKYTMPCPDCQTSDHIASEPRPRRLGESVFKF